MLIFLIVLLLFGARKLPGLARGLGKSLGEFKKAREEFDQEIIDELRNRAKDALLTRAIAKEEVLGDVEPAEDLLSLEGMDRKLAYQLASRGVVNMEDLAEQSIDELLEITEMDEERAGRLIMTARAPWFAESAE